LFSFFTLPPSEPTLLVRACNQLGQFLQHRETNLRYLALESMCTLASSEFSHEAVKTHIETVINALKVSRSARRRFGTAVSDRLSELVPGDASLTLPASQKQAIHVVQ